MHFFHSNAGIETFRPGRASCRCFSCTQVQLHAFVPLHTCETPCRYICTLSQCVYMHIYKINGGKLIQFIAFTYWPESLLQGGIMADWVCTKTGGEKGRVEEGEGKKMETCLGDIRVTRWGLKKKNQWSVAFVWKKKRFHKRKIREVGIYRYEYIQPHQGAVIYYSMPPKWIFPPLAGMIK